jgi:hypothetical protein
VAPWPPRLIAPQASSDSATASESHRCWVRPRAWLLLELPALHSLPCPPPSAVTDLGCAHPPLLHFSLPAAGPPARRSTAGAATSGACLCWWRRRASRSKRRAWCTACPSGQPRGACPNWSCDCCSATAWLQRRRRRCSGSGTSLCLQSRHPRLGCLAAARRLRACNM